MAIDKQVPDRSHEPDQLDNDLAVAARAASLLSDASVTSTHANRVTRTLAHHLENNAHRLRRCVNACRQHAQLAKDSEARRHWQRAERLATNALTLIEALHPPTRDETTITLRRNTTGSVSPSSP